MGTALQKQHFQFFVQSHINCDFVTSLTIYGNFKCCALHCSCLLSTQYYYPKGNLVSLDLECFLLYSIAAVHHKLGSLLRVCLLLGHIHFPYVAMCAYILRHCMYKYDKIGKFYPFHNVLLYVSSTALTS